MHMILEGCWQSRKKADEQIEAEIGVLMDTEKKEYMGTKETKEVMLYNQLKAAVLNNEFEPGTVMVERKLTELYHVSRSPVRYALRQLTKEGLLSNKPGIGIVVPFYNLEDILEVYDLMEVLQVYALQISLKNYDMAVDAVLGQFLEQMKSCLKQKDLAARMEWDIKFHNFMVHYPKNKRLDMLFELLTDQKRRFDVSSYSDMEHGAQTVQQHEKIFEAIKARDLERTIMAVKEHSQYIKQYYINKMVTGRYNV